MNVNIVLKHELIYRIYVDTISAIPPNHHHHNRRIIPVQSSKPCNGPSDCVPSVVESPISLARGSCRDNYHQIKSSGGGCVQESNFRGQTSDSRGHGCDFRGQGGEFSGPPPYVPPPHPYKKVFLLSKIEN